MELWTTRAATWFAVLGALKRSPLLELTIQLSSGAEVLTLHLCCNEIYGELSCALRESWCAGGITRMRLESLGRDMP
jgi:hypothetical protein